MVDGLTVPASLVDGEIWLKTGYVDRDRVREIPGCRYDPETSRWHVPVSWSAIHVLHALFADRLAPDDSLAAWGVREYEERVKPAMALRDLTDYGGDDDLYPFQRAGVGFMWYGESVIEGDEMGLGKTIQLARLLEKRAVQAALGACEDPFPALVICPNSMKRVWERELHRWCNVPDLQVQVVANGTVAGRKSLEEHADVYVINWEAVRNHSRLAPYGSIALNEKEREPKSLNGMGWKTVVADEAHRMKDPTAKQTRAAWFVAHQRTVEYRFALTGTVIANHVGDLWSLLHFLDPVEFPAKTLFMERYALMAYNMWGGLDVVGINPANAAEFFAIIDARFRRMPKALVLPQLPEITRVRRDCDMGAKQRKAYSEMEQGMLTELEDGEVVLATNNLTKNTRLIQFSSAYATLNEDGKAILSEPSSKLDELEEVMEELGWEFSKKNKHPTIGKPIAAFAVSRQLVMLMSKRLDDYAIPHSLLVGGLNDEDRQESMDAFQEGRTSIILVVMKAGGEGITLTRAAEGATVFIQRSWSMLDNVQAEGRVPRIGAEHHDSILYIDLVAPNTKEEDQITRVHEKFSRLEEINRDKARLAQSGQRNDLLDREALNIINSEV